jgi:DnaJ-class molecular chaperone
MIWYQENAMNKTPTKTKRTQTRDCRICGGAGWTDGSALLRRDGKTGSTECVGCEGTGVETVPRR